MNANDAGDGPQRSLERRIQMQAARIAELEAERDQNRTAPELRRLLTMASAAAIIALPASRTSLLRQILETATHGRARSSSGPEARP